MMNTDTLDQFHSRLPMEPSPRTGCFALTLILLLLQFLSQPGQSAPVSGPSLNIRRAGPGQVELGWMTRTGLAYQVAQSLNMRQWSFLTPPLAAPDDAPGISHLLEVEQPIGFYRLAVYGLNTSPIPTTPGHYHDLQLAHDGLPRSYDLHIPASYTGADPLPMALIFHGHGQTSESFSSLHPELFQVAEEQGLILVLPQSTAAARGTSWFTRDTSPEESEVDDVGFVMALIDHLDASLAVDRKRVYGAGFSNGASMCHRLAADTTQVFAALAMVSTTLGGTDLDGTENILPPPAEPMPVMLLNITNDCGILYYGGINEEGRDLLPARAAVDRWIGVNACVEAPFVSTNVVVTNNIRRFNACGSKPPPAVTQTNLVIREHWLGSEPGTEVLFVTLTDGGHKWTDEADNVGFNCNREVIDFLMRHCRCDPAEATDDVEIPTAPGSYNLSLCDQRYQRKVLMMIPSNYTATASIPLALALHGGGQDAASFWSLHPNLPAKCEAENVLLVVPEATVHPGPRYPLWNNKPFANVVDDRVFLTNLIERLATEINVDRKKIYASGFSNGGSMSHYFAATTTGWLAAIAPVCAATGWNDPVSGAIVPPPVPLEAVAVMMIRGTDDVKRPFYGGPNIDGVLIRSAEEDVAYWTAGDSCAPGFNTSSIGNLVTRRYPSCAGTTEVVMVRVDGMPHLWPDLNDGHGIDASVAAIEFFLRHARP